jgi:hypothetical protein
MATIKSYTDISQSKKLAEILPLESADMIWILENPDLPAIKAIPYEDSDYNNKYLNIIPAWSLAALLEQLHYEVCDDDGYSTYLQMNKEDDVYQLVYADPYREFENIETNRYEHFVDACYEMILKLKELNLL